jgi:pilus assembly protein CpaC
MTDDKRDMKRVAPQGRMGWRYAALTAAGLLALAWTGQAAAAQSVTPAAPPDAAPAPPAAPAPTPPGGAQMRHVWPAAPFAQGAVFAQAKTYEITVAAGKSQVLQLPTPYSDLMIADPTIADVMPLTDRSVYVIGNKVGATGLSIYGPGRRLIAAVNVVVSVDIETFKARLHDVLPEEHDVAVRAANDSLMLSGTVSNPVALEQIMTLANTYAPGKVVNMMSVEGVEQVMLSVRFVEMERTAAKDLNFNISTVGSNHVFVNTGQPTTNTFGTLAGTFHIGTTDLTVALDALETKGLVKTLAEPNLTTMSGETASFLAGGEFPIPIASTAASVGGLATITIEYKQFGIALGFTPTILKDGLINLVVNPEVSSIDNTISVTTAGVSVPGLKIRRAHATVELRDGESFTIAGMLSDDYQNTINQFPFVGDVPVLGALFRSHNYQTDQTELVIVVTPHLVVPRRGYVATPADHFVPPSDYELFLLGNLTGSAAHVAPEDRVLMTTDPTKGGIDGPHGHVLY